MATKYRLERHGSVFVFLSNEIVAPPTLRHDGRTLIRYMDRIFLPHRPSELSNQQVRDANEVRLLLGPEVIDSKYTQQTLAAVYRRATATEGGIRVLDFGCGDGNIAAQILTLPPGRRPEDVVGIDICAFAVQRAREQLASANCGTAVLLADDSPFKLETGYFDAIIANFVMHFPISRLHAQELARVLAPRGKLVYNDYMHERDRKHHMRVMRLLTQVGFRARRTVERFGRVIGQRYETVEQAIVECVKVET